METERSSTTGRVQYKVNRNPIPERTEQAGVQISGKRRSSETEISQVNAYLHMLDFLDMVVLGDDGGVW